MKQPGSVLKMLEEQAFEFLTKDGIMGGGRSWSLTSWPSDLLPLTPGGETRRSWHCSAAPSIC
jgi:hypothetical protein